MKLNKASLESAVNEGILDKQQAEALYTFLGAQPDSGPAFSFTNILYYFGGLIAIGAMTLFMNLGWEQFGGWGMLSFAILYASIGLGIIYLGLFWQRNEALITQKTRSLLPAALRELLAERAS
ncbi:MAG: hypothetical protein WBP44_13105 [Gammaproteobacteria bacterium]|jgi:hypothetical protein